MESLQHGADARHVEKMIQRLLNIHFKNIVYALALVTNLQSLVVEATPFANGAGNPYVGKEIHFKPVGTVAFACLATSSRLVEAESTRRVTANLGLRKLGE